jgi:hypothetical protein
MTLPRLIAGLLFGLLLAISAVPLVAQPATQHASPYYDVRQEVTMSGTVTSVLSKATPGMLMGSHLMLTTETGAVDASLGRWGLQGKGALSVGAGQSVEVTGVMKTIRNQQVFVARTVKVGARTYAMRNEHGIPVSPQTRSRANQEPKMFGSKGVSR